MGNNSFKAIVVNGAAGCGKTSFENFAAQYMGLSNCKIRSTVDIVKEIAKFCGWNGKKDPKSRKFLSDLKDALTDFNDLPHQDVLECLAQWKFTEAILKRYDYKHVFFIDSREPEDIQRFKNELGAITVLIRRDEAEARAASNHADANVLNYEYDYVIDNNGTLEDLKNKVYDFLDLIFEEN